MAHTSKGQFYSLQILMGQTCLALGNILSFYAWHVPLDAAVKYQEKMAD